VLVTVMRYWRVPVDAIATATHISSATVRRLVERFQFTGSL
jgi:DNA-binding MurR/RpiR family transcriptional regulator